MRLNELTGNGQTECVVLTVRGITPYLHASTARELHPELGVR
jgi:hypothetical protein